MVVNTHGELGKVITLQEHFSEKGVEFMNTDRAKHSRVTAIVSLALLLGSILMLVFTGVLPSGTPDGVFLFLLVLAGAMQIAAFVLGIIAVKYKPSGWSITALVLSIVVIVLEILFVAFTIWVIVASCNAMVDYFDSPEFQRTLDGCASMGFIIGR